jgi:hypothetical protein
LISGDDSPISKTLIRVFEIAGADTASELYKAYGAKTPDEYLEMNRRLMLAMVESHTKFTFYSYVGQKPIETNH